jgi:hypothetical protein
VTDSNWRRAVADRRIAERRIAERRKTTMAGSLKCALFRLDNGQPFVDEATLVTNDDGSVSFALPGGGFAGQEPNVYGGRDDNAEPKAYQRATREGSIVTFVTRPQDRPLAYLLAQGRAY